MNIISKLSSQKGDKTEKSNKAVAAICLKKPAFLKTIANGLGNNDYNIVADCAEVIAMVAEIKPTLIKRYIDNLIPLLTHSKSKVRWESMHAIAYIAELCPDKISALMPQLKGMSITDSSTIVRDYCVIAIGNYAKTGKKAAREAFIAFELILEQWKDKQAKRVFEGLKNVILNDVSMKSEIVSLIKPFERNNRASIKKAYASLLKVIK